MNDKANFRFEVNENGASWRVEIPRSIVLQTVASEDDPILFEGTFDVEPAQCGNFIGLLNSMSKWNERARQKR